MVVKSSARAYRPLHVPGHSPDSLAVMLSHEALIVGDVVLPAHRLYYQDRWNTMQLKKRLHELMEHLNGKVRPSLV